MRSASLAAALSASFAASAALAALRLRRFQAAAAADPTYRAAAPLALALDAPTTSPPTSPPPSPGRSRRRSPPPSPQVKKVQNALDWERAVAGRPRREGNLSVGTPGTPAWRGDAFPDDLDLGPPRVRRTSSESMSMVQMGVEAGEQAAAVSGGAEEAGLNGPTDIDNVGNVEIHMLRPHLNDLPAVVLPPGFSLRQGSGHKAKEDWVEIQKAAEPFLTITAEGPQEGSYAHEFEPGAGNLPEGVPLESALKHQFFLVEDASGTAVGTATAWRSKHHREYSTMLSSRVDDSVELSSDGLVHWVAIRPEWQGKGLSKVLLAAVLRCFPGMGCSTCTLGTSSGRAQAIPLYLRFGFQPLVFTEDERRAWCGLCDASREALTHDLGDRAMRSHRLVVESLQGMGTA